MQMPFYFMVEKKYCIFRLLQKDLFYCDFCSFLARISTVWKDVAIEFSYWTELIETKRFFFVMEVTLNVFTLTQI